MNINIKDSIASTKKAIVFLIAVVHGSACQHPFVLGMVSFLLLMYRFLPDVFGFLVSSSPIIICTTLLLGLLLTFGQPNIPEIEEHGITHTPSPPQSCGLAMEEDGIFSTGSHRDNREKAKHGSKSERGALSSASNEEEEREPGASVGTGLPIKGDKNSINVKNIETNKRIVKSIEHLVKVETHDYHDPSNSDSGTAESSSNASATDVTSMLDELHPILDSEDLQPINAFMNDLHSMSGTSTEDDGDGEEAENQVEGEEAKEGHEDGATLAVKWTEDDAKNLLVLGTSDLERNQKLENLIAKRRARKNLSVDMNLIDFDVHETLPTVDEHSCYQMHIPPISTSKQNPFDLSYVSDPIPGSAPSVLVPRPNPFDLPLDPADETSSVARMSHQDSVAVPKQDMFFRRHASFVLGASTYDSIKHEEHNRHMPTFDKGDLWVAPLNLSFVDQNESRSREVKVIREQDVIQVELTELGDEYDNPFASSLPESPATETRSHSVSSRSYSSEGTAADMGEDFRFSEQENAEEAPHLNVSGMPASNSRA